jgi:hypothetical protein
VNIKGGIYNTHIVFTQLDNVQGPTGPAGIGATGPAGPSAVPKALPISYYYLSSDSPITGPASQIIKYNTYESSQSGTSLDCTYNPSTGILQNNSTHNLTIMISGQITTDNTTFDTSYNQPAISIVKGGNALLTSSVINFQGSSFSTSIVLNVGEQLYVRYTVSKPSTVNIKGGVYNTHIVFTQLDNVQGPTGPVGPVVYYAITFDGGNSASAYPFGPAFDCGLSI